MDQISGNLSGLEERDRIRTLSDYLKQEEGEGASGLDLPKNNACIWLAAEV